MGLIKVIAQPLNLRDCSLSDVDFAFDRVEAGAGGSLGGTSLGKRFGEGLILNLGRISCDEMLAQYYGGDSLRGRANFPLVREGVL